VRKNPKAIRQTSNQTFGSLPVLIFQWGKKYLKNVLAVLLLSIITESDGKTT